jgi:AmmeMemoRadiSam system protein B
MDYPKLRSVETFPVEVQGERFVGLRDPMHLTDKVLFLPPPTLFIISHFDGRHSLRDIQAAFMRKFGELIFLEKIQEIARQLDSQLFLDTERFHEYETGLRQEFLVASVRQAVHAGVSYPKEPEALRLFLEAHFEAASREGSQTAKAPGNPPKGVIAPHIDLHRGGVCYGWAYEQIKGVDFDLFVILGTAHAPTRNFFAVTAKDFETPLGLVRTDRSLVYELEHRYGRSIFEDEFAHKVEHSLEFQVVYLKYLFEGRLEFKILPILCGSFHEMLMAGISPHSVEKFQGFVQVLRELLKDSGQRICIIAGADLSHVGLRFGDPVVPDTSELQCLEQEDLGKIKEIANLNREGFWKTIQEDNDRRRVCGFPCIYTMLNLLQADTGKLLRYGQMNDSNTGSAVSYASMVFY